MSHAVQQRTARSRAEQAAISHLIDRLSQQFPELGHEEIVRTVEGRYAEFEGSRVRDFVPVLVERAVRKEIDSASQRRP